MDPIFVKTPKDSFLGLIRLLWKIGLRYILYSMTNFMQKNQRKLMSQF